MFVEFGAEAPPASEAGLPDDFAAALPEVDLADELPTLSQAIGPNILVANLPRVIESTAAPDADRAVTVPDGIPISTDGSEGSFSLT